MLAKNELLQGRYRIIRQLGHGGMGAVYEALDERFGSPVALKEIIIDFDRVSNTMQQSLMRQAFEREARILAHLHHEAFPHIRDYFAETDREFLVMELIGGDDLAELLAQRQIPFLLEDVMKWADQLLDALDYLHTLEPPVIHRDLKPQNLKITSRGKIKLLDFGIAKGTDAPAASAQTNKTFIAATLNYSPLEQILPVLDPTFREYITGSYGEKIGRILQQPTDARSDLYALGATLYHLATATVPTDALKRTLEIWAGKPDPLPSATEKNAIVPKEISDILLKAMEPERENRFASAKEMRDALNSAMTKQRPVEEEAKYILWLAEQDRSKAEQDRLNQAPQALETQPQSPENQSAEITDSVLAIPTQNSSEFTKQSYLAAVVPEPSKEKIPVEPLPVAKNVPVPPKKNRKILWLLPIAALLLLMLGSGAFGVWWVWEKFKSGKPTPTPTPIVNATPEPTVETTPEVSPLPTSTEEIQIATPTQMPTIKPNSETPSSVPPTPTSSTKTPTVSTPTPKIATPTRIPVTPTPTRPPTPIPPTPKSGCSKAPPPGCRQLPNCIIEC